MDNILEVLVNVLTSTYAIIIYSTLIIAFITIMVILLIVQSRQNKDLKSVSQIAVEFEPDKALAKGKEKKITTDTRFSILKQIDKKKDTYSKEDYINNITLKMFCDDFRNYAANELGLFYREEDIRAFIAGLGVSHIMILQGMSGTGKTSLAYAFGRFVENPSTVIPIQPMWKERTDLIGYYNEFTKHFNETALLKKMYDCIR